MEEDLRGYLDWITQAEDLDNEPTSSGPNSSSNRHGGDNGEGTKLAIQNLPPHTELKFGKKSPFLAKKNSRKNAKKWVF